MSNLPRLGLRPRGRYVNIDADDTEIGYLTITTEGQADRAWAYDLGDRWLVVVAYECYRAVLASTTATRPSGRSSEIPGSTPETTSRSDSESESAVEQVVGEEGAQEPWPDGTGSQLSSGHGRDRREWRPLLCASRRSSAA